jgi:hypothetical protein
VRASTTSVKCSARGGSAAAAKDSGSASAASCVAASIRPVSTSRANTCRCRARAAVGDLSGLFVDGACGNAASSAACASDTSAALLPK